MKTQAATSTLSNIAAPVIASALTASVLTMTFGLVPDRPETTVQREPASIGTIGFDYGANGVIEEKVVIRFDEEDTPAIEISEPLAAR